jgi:hypothetical protein
VDRLVLKAMIIPGAEGAIIWHRSEPDWHFQEKPIHLSVAIETGHFDIRHSSFVIDK